MKHLGCQATTVAVFITVLAVGDGAAHWTIASTLTTAGSAFHVTLHYEVLAGQPNPDEPLKVCFWLERHDGGRFQTITEPSCERLTLNAAAWRTLEYPSERLRWRPSSSGRWPLARGQYRAVAVIGSDVSVLTRMIWGAVEERKVLPFEVSGAESSELTARGRALVERANCGECHTPITSTGEPDLRYFLAGHIAGTPVPSPSSFKDLHGPGVAYARNLTPDPETGLGRWTLEEFRRALKEGRGRNGRPLNPYMPWPRFSQFMSDADIEALWAYLRSLPPVRNKVPEAVPFTPRP